MSKVNNSFQEKHSRISKCRTRYSSSFLGLSRMSKIFLTLPTVMGWQWNAISLCRLPLPNFAKTPCSPHNVQFLKDLNSHEWPRQNSSSQSQYNIQQTSDENNKKKSIRMLTSWSYTKFSKVTLYKLYGR